MTISNLFAPDFREGSMESPLTPSNATTSNTGAEERVARAAQDRIANLERQVTRLQNQNGALQHRITRLQPSAQVACLMNLLCFVGGAFFLVSIEILFFNF